MLYLLLRWVVLAIAVAVAAQLLDGIAIVGGPLAYVIVAGVFGLLNAVVGSILRLVTFPLTILTLGLWLLVINAILLLITAALTDLLRVDGFLSALVGGLVIGVLSAVLNRLVGAKR